MANAFIPCRTRLALALLFGTWGAWASGALRHFLPIYVNVKHLPQFAYITDTERHFFQAWIVRDALLLLGTYAACSGDVIIRRS